MSNKDKKIYHRNDLRVALSSLGLPPRRILWLILSQFPRDDDGKVVFVPGRKFIITAKQYSELCQIDESVAYKQLRDGVKEIRTHMMEIKESRMLSVDEFDSFRKSQDLTIVFTVANYGAYSDGEGFIEVSLDPIVAPFFSNLNSNFTGQFLLSALRLSDGNANKLYLLIREWISSGMFSYKEVEVDALREMLGVDKVETYLEYKHFYRLFFLRAAKKIIENTEFSMIDMEIIERRKRKASIVRISYQYGDQDKHKRDADLATVIPSSKAPHDLRPSKRALEMMEEVESLKK